jgi:hypothetical protein
MATEDQDQGSNPYEGLVQRQVVGRGHWTRDPKTKRRFKALAGDIIWVTPDAAVNHADQLVKPAKSGTEPNPTERLGRPPQGGPTMALTPEKMEPYGSVNSQNQPPLAPGGSPVSEKPLTAPQQ